MPTRIFINSRAQSASQAIVTRHDSLIHIPFPDIVAGNKIQYYLFLVDGDGSFESFSGDATNYSVKLALGASPGGTKFVEQASWVSQAETVGGIVTAAWKGSMDYTDADVLSHVSGLESREAWIELQITETAASLINTYILAPVTVRNRIIT